jgi:hypothetical protein
MRHRLLIFASGVSFALLCVIVGAWIRSYFVRDEFSWWTLAESPGRSEWSHRSMWLGRGRLRIDWVWGLDTGSSVQAPAVKPGFSWGSGPANSVYVQIDGPPPQFACWGVVIDRNAYELPSWDGMGLKRFLGWILVVPMWMAVVPLGVLPVIQTLRMMGHRRRARREAMGLCPFCGYDLRAHKAGQRCPECGQLIGERTDVGAPGTTIRRA